jgi:hypothetical protein
MKFADITPELVEKVGKAICREQCAFMGEPPCWEVCADYDDTTKEWKYVWPSPNCDEPGCVALAQAALLALASDERNDG